MGKIYFFMEKENHLKPFGFFLENLVMKQQDNMFKSTLVLLSIVIQVIEIMSSCIWQEVFWKFMEIKLSISFKDPIISP